jgi:hypothetical protein
MKELGFFFGSKEASSVTRPGYEGKIQYEWGFGSSLGSEEASPHRSFPPFRGIEKELGSSLGCVKASSGTRPPFKDVSQDRKGPGFSLGSEETSPLGPPKPIREFAGDQAREPGLFFGSDKSSSGNLRLHMFNVSSSPGICSNVGTSAGQGRPGPGRHLVVQELSHGGQSQPFSMGRPSQDMAGDDSRQQRRLQTSGGGFLTLGSKDQADHGWR